VALAGTAGLRRFIAKGRTAMAKSFEDLAGDWQAFVQREETFHRVTDENARAAELEEALKPFGPDGPWKYAPADERTRVARAVQAGQDQLAGEALFELEHAGRKLEVELDAIVAARQEPPNPEEAAQAVVKMKGLSLQDISMLSVLDELRRQRFEREFGPAMPDAVVRRYQKALEDPFAQENASLIRWVETQHGTKWTGVDPAGDLDQAMAAQKLQTTIKAARQARVPEDVTQALAAVKRAYSRAEAAKRGGVRSQRPGR
jgi:hypothetical protein